MKQQLRAAAIVGTGSYVPERILSNADLEKMVDTSDEWISTRTGIRERRLAGEGMATSDMAVEAAKRAMENARIRPEDVDLLIIATITPDKLLPAAACYVQYKLGLRQIPCFDLVAACSGFIYGIVAGSSFIRAGVSTTALVVGAETLSRITDYEDRGTCVLFGDGAGAAVMAPADGRGEILYTTLGADGIGAEMMQIPAGGSLQPTSQHTLESRDHYMKIQGRAVYKFAVEKMVELVQDAVKQCSLTLDDVKLIVPHQVNRRILEAAAERLGIPISRVYVNIDRYGNTSAASVPIALDEAAREGRLQPEDVVVLAAFGGGLTWASAVVRW